MKLALPDTPTVAVAILHVGAMLPAAVPTSALAGRQLGPLTPGACRLSCDPTTDLLTSVGTLCQQTAEACQKAACDNRFLDAIDACTVCLVEEGAMQVSEASEVAETYTSIRAECRGAGYAVGAASTADTGVPKAGNGGTGTGAGTTTGPDTGPHPGSDAGVGSEVTANGNESSGTIHNATPSSSGVSNPGGSSNGSSAQGTATPQKPSSAVGLGISGTLLLVSLSAALL